MNRNNSYERCWLGMHADHCPTWTIAVERPLVLLRGGEAPARAEVSSELGAGATLTDFYSSPSFRWARPRHSLVPTSQSSSLICNQQRPVCLQVVPQEFALETEVKNRSWGSYAGEMSSSLFFLLPALGGYALVSQYLLKNPLVLHKKKRSGFYCTHISHRGGESKGVSLLRCWKYTNLEGCFKLEPLSSFRHWNTGTGNYSMASDAWHPQSGASSSSCWILICQHIFSLFCLPSLRLSSVCFQDVEKG